MLKRKYVNRSYELFFSKDCLDDLYLICQDPGLDSLEYLSLKRNISSKGGDLFKLSNKSGVFSNISDLFCGGSLCVDWGILDSITEYKSKVDYLEEQGCVVLAVLHQNRINYSLGLLKEWNNKKKLKRLVFRGIRKRQTLIIMLKEKLNLKYHAYISSIKKKS